MYNKLSRVGHLKIIDLSSTTAVEILKSEVSLEEFKSITTATSINPIVLSDYALDLINAFNATTFLLKCLQETLYAKGFRKDFDLILSHDASVIEITTR